MQPNAHHLEMLLKFQMISSYLLLRLPLVLWQTGNSLSFLVSLKQVCHSEIRFPWLLCNLRSLVGSENVQFFKLLSFFFLLGWVQYYLGAF